MSIYFVQPAGGGHIKIGSSEQVDIRHRTISRLFPYGIDVLAIIDGGRKGESFIHQCFRPIATAMEWFRSDPALWRFIIDLQDHGVPDYMPPAENVEADVLRATALAEFGSAENALAQLGYSPFSSFSDCFGTSTVGAGGRARLAFYMALKEGRLPRYIADLHAPLETAAVAA